MRHNLMEEPYAVIPHVRICAGYHAWKRIKTAVECMNLSTATTFHLIIIVTAGKVNNRSVVAGFLRWRPGEKCVSWLFYLLAFLPWLFHQPCFSPPEAGFSYLWFAAESKSKFTPLQKRWCVAGDSQHYIDIVPTRPNNLRPVSTF